MLVNVEIVNMYFLYLNLIFSFKARRGLQRQNVCCQNSAQCQPAQRRTPRSVSLRRDGLRAVLACAETDSAQCQPAQRRTSRSVADSDSAQCQSILDCPTIFRIFQKIKVSYRYLGFFFTPCSVNQCEVRLRAVLVSAESLISRISRQKRIFQQSRFSLFIRGPAGEKNVKKSRDTATLKNL